MATYGVFKQLIDDTSIYNTFKKAQIDVDFGEDITKELFINHFKKEGIEENVIILIFNSIESESNGSLTTTEWFKWQRKQCTKTSISTLLQTLKVRIIQNNIHSKTKI